jgi:hypothetical protein
MISSQLRYDLDFTRLLISHTKKTIAKPYMDKATIQLLTEQLARLELKFEQLLAELPKKKKNATPTP